MRATMHRVYTMIFSPLYLTSILRIFFTDPHEQQWLNICVLPAVKFGQVTVGALSSIFALQQNWSMLHSLILQPPARYVRFVQCKMIIVRLADRGKSRDYADVAHMGGPLISISLLE
jgi:hypothetical protein